MGLYDHWPYTNFHELNLSWLLRRMEELANVVENFVSLNSIKYADPIQWNITTQYATNTVVLDPNTGTAYLSVQPVPADAERQLLRGPPAEEGHQTGKLPGNLCAVPYLRGVGERRRGAGRQQGYQ